MQNLADHTTPMDSGYRNVDPSPWQETYTAPSKSRRTWIIAGSVIGLIALIGVAVGVGVAVSHHNSNRAATSSGSSTNSPVVSQTNPNDPSTFVKNPQLRQSFWGMAYTPEGSLLPNCGSTLSDVITDIQLISQVTTNLRLYAADCNQTALVLEAIKQTKVNMSVWLGNYNYPNDNGTAYQRQRQAIVDAINTYGTSNIAGITVGNEFMLNYLTAQGSNNPNSAIGNTGAKILIADIQDTRTTINSMNLPKHIPIGNSDAGSYFNTLVLEAVDYGMANVHPWFGNVSIDAAAGWTYDFFENTDVYAANAVSNRPTMYIAETGWPSASSDTASQSDGPSTASIPNLQEFLNNYVCQANANGTNYFYFEAFDETWKDQKYGGVEGHWGLFNANKTFKSVTIPTCS